jgi:hypothetical protein
VRDVESALHAYLNKRIDHRVISVVLEREDEPPAKANAAPLRAAPSVPKEPRAMPREAVAPEAVAERPAERRTPAAARSRDRVRFVSANLYVSGLRTQAQVELAWQGMTRAGSATGASTRDNAARLVASATLHALQPFLGEERALAVDEVVRLRLGRRGVVVVTVKLLEGRTERLLTGSCTVEQDLPQSVVYATLAAVNRVLGGMTLREPVEYELRPASA